MAGNVCCSAGIRLLYIQPYNGCEKEKHPGITMIVFNTTMKVGTGIHIAWLQWQKEQHIPEIMDSGLFTDYKFFRLLEQDEQDGITYVLQFYCSGYDDYKKYRDEFHGMFE